MLQSEKKQVDIVSQGTNTHGKGKDGVGGMRMMSWKTIILIRFSLVCLSPPTTDLIFFPCQIIRFVHNQKDKDNSDQGRRCFFTFNSF